MSKLTIILCLVCFGVFGASCTPDATEQELKAMCENLVVLRGEVPTTTVEEAVAEVEADFATRAKANKRAAEMEKEDWDSELEAGLKVLKAKMEAEQAEDAEEVADEDKTTEEDLQKLRDKIAAKKTDTDKRYAERAKELGPDKELGIKAAKGKVKKAQAKFAKAVDECLANTGGEPVPQPLAQCRAKATSTDQFWNVCK